MSAGEQVAFGGVINTTVHTIMYSYYFLAALGPHIKKRLWWKKYLTSFQIVSSFTIYKFIHTMNNIIIITLKNFFQLQFILIILYVFSLFVFDCKFPKLFMIYLVLDLILFLYMFMMFYKKTYKKCHI